MPAPFLLKSPLAKDVLLLQSCLARESISVLGETQLSLLSEKADIAPDELLGKTVTVTAALQEDAPRHLHGYVTRFAQGGFEGKHCVYQMTVRPWLWLLTRTADCRIFQDMAVPDIVKKVFQDHPVANFEFKLYRSYRQWIYCVQYRETDFNFIARLLEHEGIYWYIEHGEGEHKLVLTDSSSAHDAAPGCEKLAFYGSASQTAPQQEFVSAWNLARAVKSGKVVIKDYDFERPSADLTVQQACTRKYDLSEAEVFDYPGGYLQTGDGRQYAEDRIDEIQSGFETFSGSANAVGIAAGRLLGLQRHPREDQNGKYLVTATTLRLAQPVHESGDGAAECRCDFAAIAAASQYRPARVTPKPSIPGPQTAIVTGPSGDEIFTDKYGRVKVKFPWDRDPERNEKSSCWLSVSNAWAGSNFGAMHVPRIGQEVIVGFLEGDPDRPIVIGRAYNAENMPPWDLPANATQSGILSRSSKGGAYGNANAIRFEDKKGSEQVWLHAEKNQDIEVENDETHWVGHDRTKTIDHDETVHVKHDRTETVDNDETITVHHDRTERVDHDEVLSIGHDRSHLVEHDDSKSVLNDLTQVVTRDRSRTVGGDESVRIGKMRTETVVLASFENVGAAKALSVGGAYQVSVGAAMNVTVGGLRAVEVGAAAIEVIGGNRSVKVGGSESTDVGKDQTVSVKKDLKHTVSGKRTESVQKEYTLTAKKATITAEDELLLVCGSAKILLKKNGDIQIAGKKISIKGSGDVVVKGSKILEN